MSVSVNIRVDSDRHVGLEAVDVRHFVDDEDLLKRLAVEGLDTELHSLVYLLVTLADSGIYDLPGRETAAVRVQDFITADTVSAESFSAYIFKKPAFHIRLHGVMHLNVVLCSKFRDVVHCLVKEVHIVEIERRGNPVKFLYCVDV